MNPYCYHHTILQQPHYAYGLPISPVPAPWIMYDQVIPVHYVTGEPFPRFVHYLDDVAILDTHNTMSVNQEPPRSSTQDHHYVSYLIPEQTFTLSDSDFLEETLMMAELEQQLISGSGLSEEEISKHLHVYTAQGKKMQDSKVDDTCSICLCDCEKKEKIGRLECGHQFHAVCIKSWLLSKNSCPMCRSDALRV